jgi:hypothetical protein
MPKAQATPWAFGSLAGSERHPVHAASPNSSGRLLGDRSPTDHRPNTFNPLFPNGKCVTLSGYTGY